jgi:hypothetical protein
MAGNVLCPNRALGRTMLPASAPRATSRRVGAQHVECALDTLARARDDRLGGARHARRPTTY